MSYRRRLTAAPVSNRNVAGVLNTLPWIVNAEGVLCGKTLYVLTAVWEKPPYAWPVAPGAVSFPGSAAGGNWRG